MRTRSKKNMKMIVFLSRDNPLWAQLLGDKPSLGRIRQLAGVRHTNHTNWENGGDPKPELARKVFEQTGRSIDELAKPQDKAGMLKALERIRSMYEDDSVKLYDTAIAMRVKVETAQRLIDGFIYSQYPLFPELYFSEQRSARAAFETMGGLYKLFVWHRGEPMRCALRVRYLLDVRGGSVLRCKLNLPPEGARRPWQTEYDGFVALREHDEHDRLFWMFEGRKQHKRQQVDYLYAVTSGLRDVADTPCFCGRFLGAAYPDGAGSGPADGLPHVADDGGVFAEKATVAYDDDLDEVRNFMGDVSLTVDARERERLAALMRAFAAAPPIVTRKRPKR